MIRRIPMVAAMTCAAWWLLPAVQAQQMAREWRCTNCEPATPRELAFLKCFQDMPSSGDYRRDERWRDECLARVKP